MRYTYTFPCVYPRCLVPLHAACCDENASGHHHYNKMQLSDGNSTCQVVNKIIRSPNRTNRPNGQASKGSLSLMRCNFRMENTICQIKHNIFHSSHRTNRNSTCRVVNKIFHSPNRTNRPHRQTCKGSLSLMRCNFRMENTICQIEHNIFHSSNRTNRNKSAESTNLQGVTLTNEMQVSDRKLYLSDRPKISLFTK